MVDRVERRFAEAAFRTLMKPMAALFPTVATTPITTLAKAMVNCAASPAPTDKKWELFDNKAIFQLAGELGGKKPDVQEKPNQKSE